MTSRHLAFGLLQKAEKNDQFLNIALDHALLESGMNDADRALASALIYGVTERKLTLDYQLERLCDRPLKELDLPVLTALRLGLYQLIYLDRIPAHAALNETVSLLPKKTAGYVNAVLRKYTREPRLVLPERANDPAKYLSVAYSVGLPLCQKLIEVFGEDRTESLLRHFEKIPATTISVNTMKISKEELQKRISDALPTPYAPNGLMVSGSVRSLYGYENGSFFVQDEASQICVEALGALPNETVMDICSCPGSKSFGSAIRMNNQGSVHSFDLHEKKLSLVESGARRLGILIIKVAAQDGRKFLPQWEGRADRVLCDVPCSGFGVISKKPDLRYKDPKETEALPDIQLAILENACRYVRVGGTLVYSTCTILPEENENNIRRFLDKHPEFVLSPFQVGALSVESGAITLFPDIHNMDGFFIARMIKKG